MRKVESIEEIKSFVETIRNLRQGFVTNFYLDEEKHAAWIETGKFLVDQFDDTIFLLYDHEPKPDYDPLGLCDGDKDPLEGFFTNLFYISTSYDNVIKHLKFYHEQYNNDLYVLDIVGRDSMCEPMNALLESASAQRQNTLVRMNRIGEVPTYESDDSVVYACEQDLPQIEQWLHEYFNPKLEQLPLSKELNTYIQNQRILVCQVDGHIAGFLIFELNASTLYLRYWFTHPDFRNKMVGSRLLRRFLYEGKLTKRQLLWVLQDNENAIKRYEHYGFKPENMYDYIYFY